MSQSLPHWPREHLMPGGFEPLLYYRVYGNIQTSPPLDGEKYRCAGVPDGVNVTRLDRDRTEEEFMHLLRDPMLDVLRRSLPDFERLVRASSNAYVVLGSPTQFDTLDYFRDTIGLLTYLLDQGGLFVFDGLQLRCWPVAEWKEEVFAPAEPRPLSHCVILWSEDEDAPDRYWYHTRGLRKFGRPDVSVRRVPEGARDRVVDLCARYIGLQAAGGVLRPEDKVRMKGLPRGNVSPAVGDFDEPDFNNVHHEIMFPAWK